MKYDSAMRTIEGQECRTHRPSRKTPQIDQHQEQRAWLPHLPDNNKPTTNRSTSWSSTTVHRSAQTTGNDCGTLALITAFLRLMAACKIPVPEIQTTRQTPKKHQEKQWSRTPKDENTKRRSRTDPSQTAVKWLAHNWTVTHRVQHWTLRFNDASRLDNLLWDHTQHLQGPLMIQALILT